MSRWWHTTALALCAVSVVLLLTGSVLPHHHHGDVACAAVCHHPGDHCHASHHKGDGCRPCREHSVWSNAVCAAGQTRESKQTSFSPLPVAGSISEGFVVAAPLIVACRASWCAIARLSLSRGGAKGRRAPPVAVF